MIIAASAWLLAALMCLVFMRRLVYNFGDPLIFENMSIPFSAALLTVLWASDFVRLEKLILFTLVLLGFLCGIRVAAAFFGRDELRRAIVQSVSRFAKGEIYFVLLATMAVTVVLTVLAIQLGALGDNRTEFNRAFRPLTLMRTGLFLFSLLLLLSPKLSGRQVAVWLTSLVVLSIAFSGKGVFVPVFYWFGLRYFVLRKKASFVTIALMGVVMLIGVGIMGIIAYGASNSMDVLLLIANRFWMYGDIYIYAYKLDALAAIRNYYDVSFIPYMLHPITSLLGVRAYDKPLGSMIMSQAMHSDVLGGPNPQLPVLLDFFFPDRYMLSICIAFLIGVMVLSLRSVGIRLAKGRSRYLALGGVAAAVFCPAAGFVDTSQVLIALVGVVATTVFCVTLEMLVGQSRRKGEMSDALVADS